MTYYPKVYLQDVPLAEAKARFEAALIAHGIHRVLAAEEIPLDEGALGRTLAEPLWAKASSPHYNAAAMDGFAVKAADTSGAAPAAPLTLVCDSDSETGRALYLDTGDALPKWADAVIPIENVEVAVGKADMPADPRQAKMIRLRAPTSPWQHIRPYGEDMVVTQLVLPAGQVLRPVDLGAAAACGHSTLVVSRQPRVAIIPTGDELVSPGAAAKPGEIVEFNSIVLAAQVNSWGGVGQRYPILPDDLDAICEAVLQAAQHSDLVLLNAGSSAGSADYSAQAVERLGELLVHGVAVRPGHPVILGIIITSIGRPVPIIGVPGYPVSAALTAEIFVEPLLAGWLGRNPWEPEVIKAALTRKVVSPAGDDDYLRVILGRVDEKLLAAPLPRGSGVISSLVRADGITIIPAGKQGLALGETISVRLYRQQAELERTIFAIGSHDLSLDLLAQFLAPQRRRLVSANVGSLGGLLALQRGEAHLAGSHLLDPASGNYNIPYIRQYLPSVPVVLLALVDRQQGLMVRRGNPKGITTLADLIRPDVMMINRQRGSGTRVLLDYHLEKAGISTESLSGYQQEEFTHLTVAAAIASGRADVGLGIAAAAQALDLDFIPLYHEPYQLVIPSRYYQGELLAPLFTILHRSEFHNSVGAMPGYDCTRMGTVIAEIG